MTSDVIHCDAFVVGRGPAGLVAALCLAHYGLNVICAGPPFSPNPDRPDTRTTALMSGSVNLLKHIGAWEKCRDLSEALCEIRIVDDTGRLLRAPEILFSASEIGLREFGYNISNKFLIESLLETAQKFPTLSIIDTHSVSEIRLESEFALITTHEGAKFSTLLVVGADGRNSPSRHAAKISTKSWTYDQTAIACNLQHSLEHQGISTEFHTRNGPFTVVPLKGKASSLVWVTNPSQAEWLMSLNDMQLKNEIAERLHGILGEIREVGPRSKFPLSGLTATAFAKNRVALVGEAGHVVPPIGAQGLNLAFRDAAVLCQVISKFNPQNTSAKVGSDMTMSPIQSLPSANSELITVPEKHDIGDSEILHTYHSLRQRDIQSRAIAIDLLNRSLISEFIPLQTARSVAMHVIKRLPPLKQILMREGMGPEKIIPDLMQSPKGIS